MIIKVTKKRMKYTFIPLTTVISDYKFTAICRLLIHYFSSITLSLWYSDVMTKYFPEGEINVALTCDAITSNGMCWIKNGMPIST